MKAELVRGEVLCDVCQKQRLVMRRTHGMCFCWRHCLTLLWSWMWGYPLFGEVDNRRLGRLIVIYYRARYPEGQWVD